MSNDSGPSNTYSNIKLEQVILGAFLQDEANYWSVHELVNMDLFASDDHKKIFAVIYELASDGRAVRVPIVAGRLGSLNNDQDPDAYLSMLLHVASKEDTIPLQDYIYELRSTSTRRKVKQLAENILKSVGDANLDPEQIVDRASERFADISRSATIEHESTVSGTLRQAFASLSKQQSFGALRPCLQGLEKMVGAFPMGSLVLWGGPPGSGKTAMAMQQMLYSSQTHPTTLFELEMDNASLVIRSTAGQTGVSMRDMLRGLNEDQVAKLHAAQKAYESRKLTIVSPSKMTIQQIRSRAFAHKRKFGLELLCVDHLKLVERTSKTRIDPVERAYENARDLKALAKDLNCVVIGLCQFTKAARQKEHPEPEMEDFYGGSLEEHADIMLANFNRNDWLKRNPPIAGKGRMKEEWEGKILAAENTIEVFKLKDRFGSPRASHIFDWDGRLTLFKDRNVQASLISDMLL